MVAVGVAVGLVVHPVGVVRCLCVRDSERRADRGDNDCRDPDECFAHLGIYPFMEDGDNRDELDCPLAVRSACATGSPSKGELVSAGGAG